MFAKSTKTLLAALVLAAASFAFVANASAVPSKSGWSPRSDDSYMQDHHDPTNTNGG
jgi:ABC-type sugar transport system substrate-binding protein